MRPGSSPRGMAQALACAAACLATSVSACRSPGADAGAAASASVSQPPPPAAASSAAAAPAAPSAVDELLRRYKEKLPPAETLSQQNGASLRCGGDEHSTYTRLEMAAGKVPIDGDADVARLVPWSRDPDPCIRQIAIEAILRKVPFDGGRRVVPSMHETDHHLFHEILSSTKTWLDTRHAAYDDKVFHGLMLDITDAQFASWMKGRWEEEVDRKWKNFQYLVTFDGEVLRVVHDRTNPDPEGSVSTSTARIAAARVNQKHQWVVSTAWTEESSSRGYQGKRVEPSARVYSFWPVSEDVVWFDNGSPGSWTKLQRKP